MFATSGAALYRNGVRAGEELDGQRVKLS